MEKRLDRLPLKTLRSMLRATERFAGPESPSVELLRRAIKSKSGKGTNESHLSKFAKRIKPSGGKSR
jgi:hypothetical protein